MSTPKAEPSLHNKPTLDQLSGIPVCKEEDPETIRIARHAKTRGRGRKKSRGAASTQSHQNTPTADDLAGTPAFVKEQENLTMGHRKLRRQH